jgi:hypothetical protein
MRALSNWVAGVFLALWPVVPASADNVMPNDRMKALGPYLWPEPAHLEFNRKQRTEFAALIAAVCRDYRNVVPTPTPEEQNWLDTELRAGGQRPGRAISSGIYARSVLANTFDQCAMVAEVLSYEQEGSSLQNWVTLTLILNEEDLFDAFSRFGVNGVGNDDIGAVNVIFRAIVRSILHRIVRTHVK